MTLLVESGRKHCYLRHVERARPALLLIITRLLDKDHATLDRRQLSDFNFVTNVPRQILSSALHDSHV